MLVPEHVGEFDVCQGNIMELTKYPEKPCRAKLSVAFFKSDAASVVCRRPYTALLKAFCKY